MCLICAEISKNRLTPSEAWSNLSEMYEVIEEEHLQEVFDKIMILEEANLLANEASDLFDLYNDWADKGCD
jgi:hypothetical protein